METTDNPEFKPFTNDFTEEEALKRRARAIAASKNLFRTDISKLDDAQVSGLYQVTARALFQIEDPDGKVAFGKRAGDARTNVGLLRDFCKGNYKLIQDDEYESWRTMDEEQKFRYALEHEGASAKVKGFLSGNREGSFLSAVGVIQGAVGGINFRTMSARDAEEAGRRVRESEDVKKAVSRLSYETMSPEDQATYRSDVIGRYENKLSKRQVLATYLAMTDGLSDRASTLLAKAYNTGTVDVEAMEALPQKERDQAYTALSIMRGDQKKGRLLYFFDTDFTDDTAANRLQLCLYGFQQGVLGLIPDTYELGKDISKWAYAKFCLNDAERKRYIDRWDAQVRAERALKQGLPEADSWLGAGLQGAAESAALLIPYGVIGKGGKLMRAATAVNKDASWLKRTAAMLNPLRAGSQHRARAKLVEGVKAVEEAEYADTFARLSQWKTVGGGDLTVGNQLLARQLANIENYTKELRELKKLSGADLRKWGLGAASWSAGEVTAFGSFAKEYVETCDAAGISRYDSVPMAAVVGLINAQIEHLYVPGLESNLSPWEVKSLMIGSLLQAMKSDGAKGFWTWLVNRVEKGVVNFGKVVATEGGLEEPAQQIVIEHGKAISATAQKLRKEGRGDLADRLTAYWDATKDTLATDLNTFIDTTIDSLPSSVVFGATTIGNQTRRQRLHNIMTRHENRAKYAREVEQAKSEGRKIPAPPVMLSKAKNGSLRFNPDGVDYDVGIADMIGKAAATQKAITDYWAGNGQDKEGKDVRLANALTAARKAWDEGEGDTWQKIADAAQVDMRTAEVIAQYFIAEDEAKLYSPQIRAFVDYDLSTADMSEKTLERIIPGYVKGSYRADEKNGVYSGQVKLEDGSVKTIAYKVGDISGELLKSAEEQIRDDSELGKSHDARIRSGDGNGEKLWSQMTEQERYAYALRGVNALAGGSGVIEMTDADGNVSRISADDIIYLSNGRFGDVGYGPMANLGTARHETWHAIWRFTKSTFTEDERRQLADKLGVDTSAEDWEADLDEAMAYQFELYASGSHVPHVTTGAIDRLMQSTAAKWIGELSKFGLADEVKNAKTGKPFALADFYDAVMRGEIGTGRLGIEQVATETPQPGAAEAQKKTKKELPVGVSEEELAEAEGKAAEAAAEESENDDHEISPPETIKNKGNNGAVDENKSRDGKVVHSDYTLDSPANASVPDARFYRISAGDGVDLVGELVVSDARDLKTSYKGNLSDPSLQNRDETNEGESFVKAIAGSPDPLQVGTVQPRANNGFVWTTPSLDTFIGNTRSTGMSLAYENGNGDALKRFFTDEATKRGIEIPEGVEQPVMHFVLRRIESKDGKTTIYDVVRITNKNVNRGTSKKEDAKNDADVLIKEGLIPHIVRLSDGRIDTAKSAEAIGRFIQKTGAQGMIHESTGLLTDDGQERLQDAILSALLGAKYSPTFSKLMTDGKHLDIDNEKRALAKTAAELMRIAAEKPQYDLRQPLAEALDYYLNWRDVDERKREEAGKNRRDWYERTKDGMRKRGLTWEMHMGQGDMFRTPSPEARLLGDLLAASRDLRSFDAEDRETDAGKKRAQDLVTGFLGDYIRNADAVNTETVDLLGTPPPSRIELLETHRGTSEGGTVRFSTVGEKESSAQGPLSGSDQTQPVQFSGGATSHALTPESADPVRKFAHSISQNGAESPAGFLVGLFKALGSAETNPDKSQYFSIEKPDGRVLSLRLANHRASSAQYLAHDNTAQSKLSIVVKMSEKQFIQDARVDLTEFVYFPDKLTADIESGIADGVASWIERGEYDGPTADQVNVSPRGRMFSTTGLYTGSATDYERPSLLKVGTGDGSQVYGWGLYASQSRSEAEKYQRFFGGGRHENFDFDPYRYADSPIFLKNGKVIDIENAAPEVRLAAERSRIGGDKRIGIEHLKNSLGWTDDESEKDTIRKAIKELEENDYTIDYLFPELDFTGFSGRHYLYEQAFFTDRAPGDESHLLVFEEPVSDENRNRIASAIRANGMREINLGGTGSDVYRRIAEELGSPKEASLFLARADIDGIKYKSEHPDVAAHDVVGQSYDYVSFRDDNIRVDHKWVDGQQRFSTIAANLSTESRLRRTNASTQTDTPAFKAWFADSKIVDGEGRPLRVYRGAEFNPVKQPDGKGVIKPMSYFSADPGYARRYGEVEAYYLKIEHPFDIRDPECEADFKKVYPNVTLARGDSGALDWAEAATVDDEFLEENFPGKYDGIIFDEQKDWTTEGNTAKWRGLSYVPLFGGSQVKSATHNRGTFDPANPDIRYSTVGRFGAANLGIEGSLEASRMEEAGVDRVDIWRQTGWWRGNDGKWRVEVDPPYLADRSKFEFLKGGELVYLGDLFPDSPVIRAYGLEWTPVIIDFDGERQVLNGATAAYGFQINGKEGIILSPSLVRNADTKPSAAQLHMLENFSSDYAAFSKEFWRIFNEYDKLGEEKADEQERKAREEFGATDAAKIYEDIRSENGERFIPNERFLSVMTHEIQHIIQDREGFAKGGNPGLYSKGTATAEIDERIARLNAEIDKVAAAGEDREAFDRLRKEVRDAEAERLRIYNEAKANAILRYQHLAGEVEARNVEKRLKMPIEKRLATPPWETDDVKADDQIVRYSTVALPGGKEVSVSDAWQYRRPDGTLQDRRYSKFLAKSGGTGETSAEINYVLDRLQAGIHVDTEEIEATPEWAGAMARAKAVEADVKRKYGVEYTFEIFTPELEKIRKAILDAALGSTVTRTAKVDGSDVPFEMNEALKDGESYEVKRDREVCIVIGLPSAGKSSVFVNALSKHYAARVCDSDAVKKVLPEFDEGYGGNAVHEESSRINTRIRDAAAERGDNIVLPILGYKPEKLRETIDFFKGKGYTTHLFFNELPAEKAKSRLIMRFLENGRYLPLTCVTKVGDSTINSYNEVKNEADEYAHCSNDVGRGSDPRIIESSSGAEKLARQLGFRTDGDLGRSGRQPGGSETAGGVGEESGPSVNAAAPRRTFSTVGAAYPGLNRLSDEELIAVALASKMVFGKAGKRQSRFFSINEVQRHIKALHPDWNGPKVSLESTRIYQLVRPIKAKLQEDIQRGVSQSNILQHLPERLKDEFGSEMTQQARTGARIGTAHQRAVTLLEERKVKVVEDAVRVQSGVASQILENQYGVDLSRTLMNLADNPALKKDGQGNYLPPASAGTAPDEASGASAEGTVDEKDVDEKVKKAVTEIVGKTQEELDRSEANRRSLSDQRGRDAEREAELAGEANEGTGLDPEDGDIVEIATRKAGVDLQNPRHLALFVTELARRHWVKEHGLAEDAEAFKDAVALQFLRKTAQDVYRKLVRDITYSQSRDSATAAINGFEHIPTLRGLISEMTFAGQLINARKIRETAQEMCEKLDTFLREKFETSGRFKPDKEELKRKVSAEMQLRARYARHAIWLTPNAAGKEADLLQKEIDAAATDFDREDHDAEQSRVMIENIRKINILREFGGLRYKPLAQIQSALEYWDNAQQGEADQIGRENLEREIRTKKAAEVLAKAFRNPKTKYAKDGKALASAIDNYITGHMGFTHLLRDMMRYASKEDAAAAETILQYLELEIQKGGTRVMTQKRRHADALAKAVQQIYGRNFSKVLAEFCKEDGRFAEFMGETDGKKDMPTKGRAMQLMVSLLQVGRQVEVIDETDPERKKTKLEWQGGYHDNIVKHHREAQAAKIAALLSPQDLQLVKWLGNWYDTNRQELSAVCQDLFGIGVYAETSNYMPVKMRLDAQGLEKGEAVGWTIFPKALMPRVRNERDFDTRADILQMFMARMEEGEQWKAHAKLGLEMRGIFGRSELQASVIASHGTKANALMLGFVTDILAGQGARQRAASGDAVENYTDWIRGWAALGALGGNVGVTLKQTTSIPAFGFEVGLVKTGRYMLSAFTPDGLAAMKKIWDSDERRNRWNVGNSEAVANALAGNDVGALKRLMRASMVTNKVGDCVPALVCGQGIYRDCIEQGMDEEDAMAKTWMLIERTQQSGRVENQAGFQRRTKFGRALYQFLTTQQQYLSYEARAIRSVWAKPGDLGRWGKLGETLVLNHFLLSSAYFWMGQLYKRLIGQEPDEDGELADWMVSCLLGPYGALYGLGITTTEAINTWVKGRKFGTQGQLPSLSWASNFIVHDPARLVGACFSDEKTFDDVLDAAAKWASDSNAIFRDLRKVYRWRIKEEPQ